MSEEFNHIPLKSVEIDFGTDWGTHVTCSDCGEKIPRGIINWAEHHFKCTHQFTEDAEFEVIPPLMISENKNNEMKNLKVTKVDSESIEFENGTQLYSNHDQDCCENHYLSFSDLTLSDFEGLEFDLTNEYFFKRIDGYGIELIPIHGHSVKVPGYGSNNGYYSSNLVLILIGGGIKKEFDISDCQEING